MVLNLNPVAALLCFLESYHAVGHACVLFRVRLLPRKDLVRVRYYFLTDTLTVFATTFLYTGKLRWLATLQIVQHLLIYVTWNKHPYTKKVISWSSLDWSRSENKDKWALDIALGTAFDLVVHIINAYILTQFMSNIDVLVALMLVITSSGLVLWGPWFAWSNPSFVPKWVEKRIHPIND